MQIVIDILDADYKSITEDYVSYADTESGRVFKAIKEGILLSENHGRLIDANNIDVFQPSFGTDEIITDLMAKHKLDYIYGQDEDEIKLFAKDLLHGLLNVINTAPTILKADTGGKEKE